MASVLSREPCVTCSDVVSIFKCQGCSQVFCTKHATDHRQSLHIQADAIVQKHDKLVEMLKNESIQHETLIKRIQKREEEWIERVRQVAQETRKEVENTNQRIKTVMTTSIASLKEQMTNARADDTFLEPDLTAWAKKLQELKQSLATYTLIAASSGYLAHVFNRKMGKFLVGSVNNGQDLSGNPPERQSDRNRQTTMDGRLAISDRPDHATTSNKRSRPARSPSPERKRSPCHGGGFGRLRNYTIDDSPF